MFQLPGGLPHSERCLRDVRLGLIRDSHHEGRLRAIENKTLREPTAASNRPPSLPSSLKLLRGPVRGGECAKPTALTSILYIRKTHTAFLPLVRPEARSIRMKLWMALYAMIWIVFVEFLLAMTPSAPGSLLYLHIALGLAIIGLAYYNFNGVRGTSVPARVKRIAKSTVQLSVAMGILGLLLFFDVGADVTSL